MSYPALEIFREVVALVRSGADGAGSRRDFRSLLAKNWALFGSLMFCVQEAGRGKWLTYFEKNSVDDGLNAECVEV